MFFMQRMCFIIERKNIKISSIHLIQKNVLGLYVPEGLSNFYSISTNQKDFLDILYFTIYFYLQLTHTLGTVRAINLKSLVVFFNPEIRQNLAENSQ